MCRLFPFLINALLMPPVILVQLVVSDVVFIVSHNKSNKALMTNVKAQLMERDAVYAQSLDYYC